jgi:hypothetical protein
MAPCTRRFDSLAHESPFPVFLGNKVDLSGKEEDRRGGKERFIYPSTMRKTERIPDSVSRRIGKHKVKK